MSRRLAIIILIILVIITGFYSWYVLGIDFWPRSQTVSKGGGDWETKRPMPTARTEVGIGALNGKIYAVGGLDKLGRTLAAVEVYNPRTDNWKRLPNIPKPLHHAGVAAAGGRLYVVGGHSGLIFKPSATMFSFDTKTNKWSRKADLPRPRGALAVASRQGRIYAFGGVDNKGLSDRAEVYNPKTNRWHPLKSMPTKRFQRISTY